MQFLDLFNGFMKLDVIKSYLQLEIAVKVKVKTLPKEKQFEIRFSFTKIYHYLIRSFTLIYIKFLVYS